MRLVGHLSASSTDIIVVILTTKGRKNLSDYLWNNIVEIFRYAHNDVPLKLATYFRTVCVPGASLITNALDGTWFI